MKILIVEDNQDHAEIVSHALKKAEGNFFSDIVVSADECFSVLKKEKYDLILLDYLLGSDNGLEVLRGIKKDYKNLPVIMVTGLGNEKVAVEAMKLGADDYIVKSPGYTEVLLSVILKTIRSQENIIELKKAEAAFQEKDHQYRMLVETMNDGLLLRDENNRIIYVNNRLCEMLGYDSEELLGKDVVNFFDDENKKIITAQLSMRQQGQSDAYEIVWTKKNGEKLTTIVSPKPIFSTSGKYTGGFGVITDITERKEMEQKLQRIHNLRSIGLLAGGIAHDFNNILTELLGNLQLAQLKMDHEDEAFPYLKIIENAVKKATGLTQQLLTFSKGGVPIKEAASINELLVENVKFALRGANVKSKLCLQDDIWTVEIDKGQISQVINNLVINAKQAMPDGGLIEMFSSNITLKEDQVPSLPAGEYVKIEIKDTGVGMQQEYLAHIFDPYFTTKKTGSGLGLAISFSILKRHSGSICVDSEIGKGTTFTVFLPAKKEATIKEDKKERIVFKGKERILLMDDEDGIRKVLTEMLLQLSYHVDAAAEGKEAIAIYQKAMDEGEPYSVVLLDLTIPGGMGGKATMQELLKIDPKVKAIVSSGYCTDPVMADYKQYGFKSVIMKPYKVQELSEVIYRVIKGTERD